MSTVVLCPTVMSAMMDRHVVSRSLLMIESLKLSLAYFVEDQQNLGEKCASNRETESDTENVECVSRKCLKLSLPKEKPS